MTSPIRVKWRSALARYAVESKKNPKPPCPGQQMQICTYDDWLSFLKTLEGKPPLIQLNEINNRINQAKYITDSANWGQSDYWATPAEFMARFGDCEDYAILKYLSLRRLGWKESALRVVAVEDLNLKVGHAVLIVFFPVLINVMTAVRNIDPDLINLARSFKATKMQVFWKIQVPGSMPPMFAGLRIGATLAVIGVAVGEFAGGNTGVGYLIVLTAGAAETAKVFAAIFVLTMIGIIAYWLVILLENRVLHYMPSREHGGF